MSYTRRRGNSRNRQSVGRRDQVKDGWGRRRIERAWDIEVLMEAWRGVSDWWVIDIGAIQCIRKAWRHRERLKRCCKKLEQLSI